MTKQTILVIDDDETLLEILSDHIQTAGYHCIPSNNGKDGLKLVDEMQPDLVVLDIMMPGMDGWEVCHQLREYSRIPIIMLTAKNEEFDKLRGFRLGVDDYVTKPFSFAVLIARIGAVLMRTNHFTNDTQFITSDNLTIDFKRHQVMLADQPVNLTPIEYRLLEALVQNSPRVVPTEQLLDTVWGDKYYAQIEQVKHYIWSLRKKIELDPGDPKHIITERGFGYRFE